MTSLFPSVVPNIVGGEEVPAASRQVFDVINPHDAVRVAEVARSRHPDVDAAINSARTAQPLWAAIPPVQRGEILTRICNALEARKEDLSRIVAAEAGKRLSDAMGETSAAILCGRFFAGEGQRLFGRTTTSGTADKWAMTVRQPCGVAGLIIAANTPAPNFAWKVFPALICGNAVVLKSAEDTPISSWFMATLAQEAGLPKGVLNVVHGLGAEAGQALVDHEYVDVLSFTGSTRVGRMIAETAGRQLKKVSLELGGKNPLIVCDDADIDNAVKWAVAAAFSNAGQRCAAGSRMIVFNRVYDLFLEKFATAAAALRLGIDSDCDVGPVINECQLMSMCAAVDRAVASGGRVVVGGRRALEPNLSAGFYMQPTILADLPRSDESSKTELFGPVTAIYRVDGFEEAIEVANDSPYGLTGSIHTNSIDRAFAFVARLQAGVAVVNGGTHGSEPHMPFGGLKASGNGTREPGTEALDIYSNLKDVYLNIRPLMV